MSLGIGDEPVDSFKELLQYEGGNLYALDDEGMDTATLQGVTVPDEESDGADPLGLGCVEHVPAPPKPVESQSSCECCSGSGTSDDEDHRGWSMSAAGRSLEARRRRRAEKRTLELGPKLPTTFKFGSWAEKPEEAHVSFAQDFPGPAR